MLTCMVGAVANIAMTVAAEAHRMPASRLWSGRIGIMLALLTFYFLYLPDSYVVYDTALFRMPFQIASLFLFLHLLISYVPFINKGSEEDFWEYNKDLFLNLVESGFYSGFLFVGLSIALLAMDKLFGIDIDDLAYPRLWFFLVGVFNTVYFLSKYPTVYYDNQIKTPIKAFLIFSQYILIPLVLIYMAILYAYGVQIGFKWELPEGWVSQLSLWFSVVGIFAFLLNYFNHKFSDFKLTVYFKKYFFLVLLLPIVLIFIAIYRRISEYGVTELRYVVALLGVWLLGIALYFNFSKVKNIRVIPISLSVFVLIPILLGPFNMFNASVSSQQKRFKQLLVDKSVLVDQQLLEFSKDLVPGLELLSLSSKIDSAYRVEEFAISKAIRFLDERTDLSFINDWLASDLDFVKENDPRIETDSLDQYHNARILTEQLNIDYHVPTPVKRPDGKRFHFNRDNRGSVQFNGNKYFVPINVLENERFESTLYFRLNKKKTALILYQNGEIVGELFLIEYIEDLYIKQSNIDKSTFQLENPILEMQHPNFDATLILGSISGIKSPEGLITIENIWGNAIVEFKNIKE